VNNENKQGKEERKGMERTNQGKQKKSQAQGSRGVGCNLGSAGDGFLCGISDGLAALSSMDLHQCGFPTKSMKSIGDVVNGKPCGVKSDGCCDSIGMQDKPFDVDAQAMRVVGAGA
jgi:hypothetical protein